MRKLCLLLLLFLLPTAIFARPRVNDVLLTDNGTLFAIDSVETSIFNATADTKLETPSSAILRLRVSRSESSEELIVPASLSSGAHVEPSLAYDADESRLYLFWRRVENLGASELLVVSFRDGVWSDVEAFAPGGSWVVRTNLKVVVTKLVTRTSIDGSSRLLPGLIAHAVWWEQSGSTESARYAMFEIRNGELVPTRSFELKALLPATDVPPAVIAGDSDCDVIRTPLIFESPLSDSVDVAFGDRDSGLYTIGNVRPVESEANGLIRIPVGIVSATTPPPVVRFRNRSPEPYEISAMRSENGTLVVLASTSAEIAYTLFRLGHWSPSKSLRVSEAMTREVGLEGIRRLAASE